LGTFFVLTLNHLQFNEGILPQAQSAKVELGFIKEYGDILCVDPALTNQHSTNDILPQGMV